MPNGPPDPDLLDEDRVGRALRDLGFRTAPGWEGIAGIVRGCGQVRPVPGEPVPTWAVGEHRVRHRDPREAVAADTLVCSCAGRGCAHVASVLVVLAFADPVRGAALRAPSWEVVLAPMAHRPSRITPRPGHVRYDIQPPMPGVPGLGVEPTLIRGGEGARYARTLADLKAQITPLLPCDLELHPACFALERARRLERGKVAEATRHLSRAILEPLSRASDVRLQGRPITVSAVPVTPRLVASRTDDRGLDLRWEPGIRLHWLDVGVVLTAQGVLCPLPDDLPLATAERLTDPLPTIPAADVQRFVDRLVVDRGLAVDLPGDIEVLHAPDARRARITLAEHPNHVLSVRLGLVYRRHEGEIAVEPDTPGRSALVPGEGMVLRDPAWEAEQASRFSEEVGADGVLELQGEAALDFLTDVLPRLAERWEIYGRDALVRLSVAGSMQPVVRFTEGEDWFDLDVGFTLGGRQVSAAPVIRSWLAGDRYHRLDDGSMARLPARWLEKHGGQVDMLRSARRAAGRLGSWHAWMASELLEEQGEQASRWLDWVRTFRAIDGVPRRDPPAGLTATLRGYQQRGFDWLCFLRDHGLHGVLADEMGLGKTVQALAAILDSGEGASLVVAPTSVLHGWVEEAARFAPGLKVVLWHGERHPRDLEGADLVVTSYALLRRDVELLAARPWTWAVLDEAQQIKNPASQAARAARRLVARHRLLLTGTPLENDLIELWSLFAFLMPGYLGRRKDFHARYATGSRSATSHALADLQARIRPFLLRRRKAEVAPELPARTEITVRVPLSQKERRLYDSVRLTVKQALEEAEGTRSHLLLEGLTRLRQAACHPGLLPFPEARAVTRSSKLEALLGHLEEALGSGRRCLVFSQWVRLLDRVSDALSVRDIAHLRLQGDTRDRAAVVRGFQDPDGPPVLLISIKAGGTGLNLTAADVVFHLDPWWNPQVEDQATDRAHRLGQTRPVTVYRLVAADTVEDRVLKLQAHKRRLFESTVDAGGLDVSALTADDLRGLLGAPPPG